jgi:cell division protein FtsQ
VSPGTAGGGGRGAAARRFAARVRRRRWASRRPALAAGLACVLAAVLAWTVLGSSLLGVRRVEVVGNHRLTAAAVLAAADVPAGRPLARLDMAGVDRRVAALPPVADVRVVRHWPGTVRLVVTERIPVAVARRDGGYVLLDRQGVPFWPVPGRRGLPLVDVVAPAPGDPAVRAALAVLAALPPQVRRQVTTVRAPSSAAVALQLRKGKTVVWGTAADGTRKAAVLAALLRRPGQVYDVSTPNVATIR